MDTTPKGPPVPPTPDILSPLSRRGISDLNVIAAPPHRRALHRRQRCRISSRGPPSFLLRTSSSLTSFLSSPTCLDTLRPLCPAVKRSPTYRRFLGVLKTKRRFRGSLIAAGSDKIRLKSNTTILAIDHQANEEFCTYHVFIPHQCEFDAYFTTTDQRHAGRSHRLTAVIFRIGEHIDRLRPQKRLTRKYSLKLREQCLAALPRGLCKVSDLYLLMRDACRISIRRSDSSFRFTL